jgi:hypothetical protein
MPEKPSVTPPVSHGSWGAAQAVVRASKEAGSPQPHEAPQTYLLTQIWDSRLEDSRRNLSRLESLVRLLSRALPYPQGPENRGGHVH